MEKIKKWEDRIDLFFSHLCLVGRMESGEMENLFVWLKRKMRMENEIGINLQLCSRSYPLLYSLASQHNLAFKSLRCGREASQ